jgi:putative ABC transport system ATP-binding protein
VKASNAELCENARFKKLAHTDLSERLKKKKMKALIPQIIQIMYFGGICVLCVGPMVFCGSSIDICGIVSFVTSSIFLIDPIQVILSDAFSFCALCMFYFLQVLEVVPLRFLNP